MESHDEFRELCAIATSGELSEQEQRKLREHLTGCPECRQALREFEAVVDVGVPLLASQLSAEHSERSASTQPMVPKSNDIEESVVATPSWVGMDGAGLGSDAAEPGFVFAQRNRSARKQMNWNYVWFSFAACVLLTIALGFYAYRVGKTRIVNVAHTVPVGEDPQIEALERQISDVGRERESLRLQLAQRDKAITDLKREIQEQSVSLNEMKVAQADFAKSIQNDEAEKQRVAQAQSELSQKLDGAQASLTKAQSELGVVSQQRSEVEMRARSLEAQIRDLSGELRESELTIGKQEELLAHDRDVRELMGARDLYIAEIYNVAGDGVTQKPYGRVFYTKGKSLIFYAYDLDQQASFKNARTFQAWGQRGPDRRQALNLGIFYQDNAAKKRWVLKFDDPKTLEQIDAVFVTVEPNGGSATPSGSPLLFTYLKIEANHP
jgi:predicted  nucleic acid-binding Zn-ribbon protein